MPDVTIRNTGTQQYQITYGDQTVHFFGTLTQLLAILARIIA